MSSITQRGTLRWKEWVPLVSQQQRLRNLIQIIAYNIRVDEHIAKREKNWKWSYYYTLHLTTMSAPLYTSEKLESENPKWAEIDIKNDVGGVNGIIVRLWLNQLSAEDNEQEDVVVCIWGIYFSGLVYLGPRLLCADPSVLAANTFVFHMQGGYFTSPYCFKEPHPATPRTLSVQIPQGHVKPSYTVHLLLRLQMMQQAIKKQAKAAVAVREKIEIGGGNLGGDAFEGRGSVLRRLLARPKPPSPRDTLPLKQGIEDARFKSSLLIQEGERRRTALRALIKKRDAILDANQDTDSNLMERYCRLRKDIERRREKEADLGELRMELAEANSKLDRRRKQLMAELAYIYPIHQLSNGQYTIRGIRLPSSEEFEGENEGMIAVSLGFTAHLVMMMASFLDVPTRYPIIHFGSRSRIIDHILDKIPDKDREFPLFSKGKEKMQFEYGVYLLNKNISQIRWSYGLATSDLRDTLPNIAALMNLSSSPILQLEEGSSKGPFGSGASSSFARDILIPSPRRIGSLFSVTRKKAGSTSCSLDRGLETLSDDGWREMERRDGGQLIQGRRRRGCSSGVGSDPGTYSPPPSSFSSPRPTDLASLMSFHLNYHNGLPNS